MNWNSQYWSWNLNLMKLKNINQPHLTKYKEYRFIVKHVMGLLFLGISVNRTSIFLVRVQRASIVRIMLQAWNLAEMYFEMHLFEIRRDPSWGIVLAAILAANLKMADENFPFFQITYFCYLLVDSDVWDM